MRLQLGSARTEDSVRSPAAGKAAAVLGLRMRLRRVVVLDTRGAGMKIIRDSLAVRKHRRTRHRVRVAEAWGRLRAHAASN